MVVVGGWGGCVCVCVCGGGGGGGVKAGKVWFSCGVLKEPCTLIRSHPSSLTIELVATNSFLPLCRSVSSRETSPGSSWMYLQVHTRRGEGAAESTDICCVYR